MIGYQLQVVQELRELEQALGAAAVVTVGHQAIQLIDVGGPQIVKTTLALQPLRWN